MHRRIWQKINKEQQLLLFKKSDHYKHFQNYEDGSTVGYTVWSHMLSNVGTFVCNPFPESCANEKMSGLEHMGAAPLGVTAMKHITAKLKKYVAKDNHLGFDALHGMMSKANAFQMVNSICYDKEEQPKLYIDKTKDCPEMIPLKCTHGANENKKDRCTCYGVANFLGILEALKDTEEADEVLEVII